MSGRPNPKSVSAHSEKSKFLKGPFGALHFEMVVVTPVWGNNVFFKPKGPIKISMFHIHVSQCSEETPVLNPPPPLCTVHKPPFCIEGFMLNETISYCGVPV